MQKDKAEQENTKLIRVLLVNLESKIAGAEKSLLLLVRYMQGNAEVTAACPTNGPFAEKLRQLDVETFRILSPPRKFNWSVVWIWYLLFVNLQLTLITCKVKPAIIHANSSKAVLASILAKVLGRRKLIWHVRDMPGSVLICKVCSFFSSQIIAVSNTIKNQLTGHGVKATVVAVVYNAVSTEDLQSQTKKKTRSKYPIFASIGQFVPWKKQCLFLDAAACFLQRGGEANFILIGDDIFGRDSKYKKKLLNKIKVNPFVSKIKIISWQKDLDKLWAQIDCLVHTADKEPFGRVIIEAMAHEIPVIAPNSCGPAEIIQHGATGLLFKPDDVGDLTCAMQLIARDAGFAVRLTTAARQYILSRFRAENMAQEIEEVYQKVLVA